MVAVDRPHARTHTRRGLCYDGGGLLVARKTNVVIRTNIVCWILVERKKAAVCRLPATRRSCRVNIIARQRGGDQTSVFGGGRTEGKE